MRAFFYSPGRAQLLQDFHKHLDEGGRAYISVVGFYKRSAFDRVQLKNGQEVTLFEYLILKRPDVFEISGEKDSEQPPVLTIKKDPKQKPLDLNLEAIAEIPAHGDGQLVIPLVLYREL